MNQLSLRLDPATHQALADSADARGCLPEEVAAEAVRRYLREEGLAVRAVAERIARDHAELLRRLGE
ncbi:hypothetical protein [Streptomyces brasiliensis]|uniref:Ribbon-helix-helix protein CopG domain-containing protein n=1 Tax=Streptomyces brasiliensis TaxID=1954 RepID=A0A917KKE8_9ACTN|nr:hypothetical protein [Streptomyces brasiliensis]GGJ18159.1 hypothetical protein GCM10010121_031370 [Streptomyces brasiliensis]